MSTKKAFVVLYMHTNNADCQAWFGYAGTTPKGIFRSLDEARVFVQQSWPDAQETSDENLWCMADGDEIHIRESQLHE